MGCLAQQGRIKVPSRCVQDRAGPAQNEAATADQDGWSTCPRVAPTDARPTHGSRQGWVPAGCAIVPSGTLELDTDGYLHDVVEQAETRYTRNSLATPHGRHIGRCR
jgi:hypothetical protein